MNIHYYKQFFTGPNAPGPLQPRTLVRTLAERGHQVSVVATDYNVYNEQDEPEERYDAPRGGSFSVHRYPSARRLRQSNRSRFVAYGGFMLSAGWAGLRLPRPDVVIGSIQPLFTGTAAQLVARRYRVPFVLEVRDLWPDALVVKKAISESKARPLHWLANSLYRQAIRIVSLTPGIKKELLKKGLSPAKIDVFPNGFDPEVFRVGEETRERVRARNGWGNAFVALYTGTHTEVTAIDVIVRAAAALKGRSDIRFDLVGDGQTKPKAIKLAAELGLTNVHFHDPVPKQQIPELLAAADVALMTLFRSPLVHIYFENKFMDYMGAGKPIIAAMEGEQAEIIERQDCGVVVPTFDHEGLAAAVVQAAEDQFELQRKGDNGRELVHKHLLLADIMDRYASLIEAVTQPGARLPDTWEPPL